MTFLPAIVNVSVTVLQIDFDDIHIIDGIDKKLLGLMSWMISQMELMTMGLMPLMTLNLSDGIEYNGFDDIEDIKSFR